LFNEAKYFYGYYFASKYGRWCKTGKHKFQERERVRVEKERERKKKERERGGVKEENTNFKNYFLFRLRHLLSLLHFFTLFISFLA